MPAHRKYDGDLEKDLSEERLVAATRTLLAASACYLARPKEHPIPSDAEQAKFLAEIVSKINAFAEKQSKLAETALLVELSAGVEEAYARWDAGPRKKSQARPTAPGVHLDFQTDWTLNGTEFTKQRIAQAWQEYTLKRHGEVLPLTDSHCAFLASPGFVVGAAAKVAQGPADCAGRAVAFLLKRTRLHGRGAKCPEAPMQGRSVGVARANRRWTVVAPSPDGPALKEVSTWGQPEGGDEGFFFGAQVNPGVEVSMEAFAQASVGLFFRRLGEHLEYAVGGRALLVGLLGERARFAPKLRIVVEVPSKNDPTVTEPVMRYRVVAMPNVQRIWQVAKGAAFQVVSR